MSVRIAGIFAMVLLVRVQSAEAYPVPLGTRQPLQIPARFVDQYTFFEDSDSANALYVVPRIGTVDLRQSGQTTWPRFVFDSGIATSGYFYGHDYVKLGGTFRSDARPSLYEDLAQLALNWNMQLSYAPFWSSRTRILSLGRISQPGEHVDCHFENRVLQDGKKTVSIPHCVIRENGRPLDVDLFQSFALLLADGGTVNSPVGWSARTLPGWESTLRQKLDQGAGWDDLFMLNIEWTLPAAGQKKVIMDVNPVRILQALQVFAEKNVLQAWPSSRVTEFSDQILSCGDICGLRTGAALDEKLRTAFGTWLQSKFFVLMQERDQVLAIPKSFPLNETTLADEFSREVLPLAGDAGSKAQTQLLIHCLLSPEEGSNRVRWDVDAPDCQEEMH